MDGRIALLGGPGSNAGAVRCRWPQALGTARLPLPGAPGDTARPGGAAVLGRLDDEGIDALLARQAAGRVPVHELHLYHRGGALARVPASAIAFAHGDAAFVLEIIAHYPPDTYAHLVAVKDRYDPTNLFRLNQNIRPRADADRRQSSR